MLALVMMFAVASEPTPGQLNAAIWDDLQLNAWIGNGNLEADGDWYFGTDNRLPPTLTIIDLACQPKGERRVCRLYLERTPDPQSDMAKEALIARRLSCTVEFEYVRMGELMTWAVARKPPVKGQSHSRTLLQCVVEPVGT